MATRRARSPPEERSTLGLPTNDEVILWELEGRGSRCAGTSASPDLAPTSPGSDRDGCTEPSRSSRRKSVEESAEYMTHFSRTANSLHAVAKKKRGPPRRSERGR